MIPLRDKVEIIEAGVIEDPYSGETRTDWSAATVAAVLPAQINSTTTAILSTPDEPGRTAMVEQLRAVIPPFEFDPEIHRVRHAGTDYTNDGAPLVRWANGRIHHLTIPLKQVVDI